MREYCMVASRFVHLLSAIVWLAAPALADPVADFYRATPVTVFVSSTAGGGYDAYARFLARYMGKHIPGNPTLVVKNMPGAGGATLGNYLNSVAPRDGSVFGTLQNTLGVDQLTGATGMRFDLRHLSWLGSMNSESWICAFSTEADIHDARELVTNPLVVGASGGATASGALAATLLNRLAGTHLDIIKGYDGTNAVFLAMARREVDGLCGVGWDSVKIQALPLIDRGEIKLWLDSGTVPNPELAARGVPFVLDMVPDGDNKRVLQLLLSPQIYGRPFAGPPGIPTDRLAALRAAFAATMRDPEFLAESRRILLDIRFLGPDAIMAALAEALDAPAPIRERAVSELRAAGWGQ
jgi:tripartite-type tricarboxylate transporter receptor subunit TctC